MPKSFKHSLSQDRTLAAELSGKCFNASVKALLESPVYSEALVSSVLYHAKCCERACSSETYKYVEETVDALEALGRLPRKVEPLRVANF